MALNLRLKALTAPPGAQCLTTTQAVLDNSAKYLQVTGPDGVSYIIISANEPTVDDRDKAWLRLEDNGQPKGLYKYQDDEWVLVPGVHQGAIMLYSGLVANIPAGWILPTGSDGSPDLTDETDHGHLWEPPYSAPETTYTLCPIWFKGFAT